LVCGWQFVDICGAPRSSPDSLVRGGPESSIPMAKYEQSNFEQIAAAIGMKVGEIAKHENLFEEAARWYRLDKRRPRRPPFLNPPNLSHEC
jgi:hypothetical protein